MSNFKARMHQIRFPLGLRDPAGGAYSAPPDLPAVFKGGQFLRGGRGKGEKRGRERAGKWVRRVPHFVLA